MLNNFTSAHVVASFAEGKAIADIVEEINADPSDIEAALRLALKARIPYDEDALTERLFLAVMAAGWEMDKKEAARDRLDVTPSNPLEVMTPAERAQALIDSRAIIRQVFVGWVTV